MTIQSARLDLLDALGKRYLIDLAVSTYKERQQAKTFQEFNSEMLRSITNSIAGALGGTSFPKSWEEMLKYKPETRSASEIKSTILNGLHQLGKEE